MTQNPLPRPARIAGTVVVAALAGGMVLAILAVAWIGVRGALAADHLLTARGQAQQVVEKISDPAAVADTIAAVADETAAARSLTSDVVWRAAELVPWLGPQLSAVSTLAAAADDVAGKALTPLSEVASTLTPAAMKPQDGRIELSGFIAVQDAAAAASSGITGAADSVTQINEAALVAPLRDVVAEVSKTLDQAEAATDALTRASVLLPAMLGADGPRNYLVLFQNNAEWRSLGGIAGAMVLIHTDGGSIQLVTTDAGSDFADTDASVLPLSDEMAAIYGQRPGQWMQNATQAPDFSVAAALAREHWARKHGVQVDGVIATDPVALAYILAATGPVTLPSGDTVTSENAVQLLLNEVYLRYTDTTEQDRLFADTSTSIFTALTDGRANPAALLTALGKAGDERRLLLWSAHPEDQQVLAETTLAGGLPVTDAKTSAFGVYLNDGTGAKMDYYQTAESTVAWDQCTLDSRGLASGDATLTVTLTNNAPADAANLPDYLTAAGWYGVPPGSIRTVGYLYVPEGFELVDAQITGGKGFGGGMHDGRLVLSYETTLAPGESATATIVARTTSPSGANLVAWATPTVNADVTREVAPCL